jgi:hypothetical protein
MSAHEFCRKNSCVWSPFKAVIKACRPFKAVMHGYFEEQPASETV